MNKVKFLFVLFAIDNSVCSTYASLYAGMAIANF